MAQSKATKKFEKRHLHDTIKKRNEIKKVKQRHQQNAKKKARRATEGVDGPADEKHKTSKKHEETTEQGEKEFENMSIDDLFSGGFKVAKPAARTKAEKRSGKRKRTESESDDEDSSIEDVQDRAAAESESADGSEDDDEDELKTHMEQLDELSKKDPAFYKYLKENDPELLAIKNGAGTSDQLALSDDDDAAEAEGQRKDATQQEVTARKVKLWSEALEQNKSLRVVRDVVAAFRAAVHLNDDDGKESRYVITDASAYHDLLLLSLRQVPAVLKHHIPPKQHASGRVTAPADSAIFRKNTHVLKSFTSNIIHLLTTLSDASTTRIAVSALIELIPYILSFKKLIRDVAKAVSAIWSDPATAETNRITGFLALQSLNKNGDPSIKEAILRTTYQALLKGCRNTNIHTLGAINLMKNSAQDLFASPPPTGSKEKDKEAANVPYTVAFTLIRSLAIHLRTSIKHNANEAYKQVYNWQYVHALDFWSRVLSTHCNSLSEATAGRESNLRPLIYPLVQVTLGALRLIPTAAYFPLRFHCTRALLRISAATNTYIPLAASLLEVLQSAEMRKPPRPSTAKPLDFEANIRCQKSLLRTRVYQDGVGEQVAELFAEFFGIWSTHIAFPELSVPVIVMLKRWLKEVNPYQARNNAPQQRGKRGANGKNAKVNDVKGNKNSKVNGQISLVVQKIEANSRWIEERRKKVEFSPKDRSQVEAFHKEVEWTKSPMGAFVVGQRKVREERRKVLEEARRAEEEKKGQTADDVDMEESEEEMVDGEEDLDVDDDESDGSE